MNYNENDIELFDRYINLQLTDDERLDFESQLENNPDFKTAFQNYQSTIEGIKVFNRNQLKDFLKENGKSLQVDSKFSTKRYLFIAASVILILGIAALINLSLFSSKNNDLAVKPIVEDITPYSESLNKNEELIQSDSIKMTKITPPSPIISNKTELELPIVEDASPPAMQLDDMVLSSKDFSENTSGSEGKLDSDNSYFVKTDVKVKDTIMKPVRIAAIADNKKKIVFEPAYPTVYNQVESTQKKKLPSNSNNAPTTKEETLDTATSLRFNSDLKDLKILVQFWQSPINFKGYNYINNKLQLYGLNPTNVRLFIYQDKLYLRTEEKVYIIETCSNSCVYKLETNNDIINIILSEK